MKLARTRLPSILATGGTVFSLLMTACNLFPTGKPTPTPRPLPTAIPTPPILASDEEAADIIFYNGDVLMMDEALTQAEALAVRGEKIMAVGSEAEVLTLRGERTQLIDLRGQALLPGFVDPHTHLLNDAGMYGMTPEEAQNLALENGITTLGDPYVTAEFLEEMRAMNAEGKLHVRTSLYLIYNTNCGELVGDWYLSEAPTRTPGEMLRIGGVKVFADGGSCNLPAFSYELPNGLGKGDLFITADQLAGVVGDAQDAGFQVATHALGDRAIETVLDAYELALDGQENAYRHRIEHNAILRPDLLPRYGEIGVVATIFASYVSCNPFDTPSPPEPYNQWEWAWPSLIEANPDLHIAWHGDDPYIEPISPVLELYGFVTRKQALDDRTTVCDPPDWIADDTLPVEVALPMMNREAAYALFRDEEVGTLEVGKYADLIILSANPLNVATEEIRDIQLWMTMVGSKVEYCAAGGEALCPQAVVSVAPAAPVGPATGPNLALGAGVTASASLAESPPEMAVDGDSETLWNSGASPPQWIEIDLGAPQTITHIRLAVSQFPEGQTAHRVWGRGPEGDYVLLGELSGATNDGDVLELASETGWENIQYLKIETVKSPSWVAWWEIEVYGP